MKHVPSTILICLLTVRATLADCDEQNTPPGWETWLSDNVREYDNVHISWEDPTKVPSWLEGTYMKNGPARTNFGGSKSYGNLVDGWAKINKFRIAGNKDVIFSSKFLRTPLYEKCDAAHELVPQTTLGPVQPVGWSSRHLKEIMRNSPSDNTAVTITRMGEEFIASTDATSHNVFNVSTLQWMESFTPVHRSFASSAHWRVEPGTSNILNFNTFTLSNFLLKKDELKLYRYKNGNLRSPQFVGKFRLNHPTMIHMFSVTPNYAIFFVYPLGIDLGCIMAPQLMQNLLKCVRWKGNKAKTQVVVMSLRDGSIVSETLVHGLYSTHHVNAYETTRDCPTNVTSRGLTRTTPCFEGEPQVVVDLVIPPWYSITNYTSREVLLHSFDTGRNYNAFNITRFTINLKSNSVDSAHWENESPDAKPYFNQFDFPRVNPNYEGRPYCFAYGQSLIDFVRQPLIKKNVCNSTEDKIWYEKNHYTGEPIFIPRPGATDEDDGVVFSVVLNGSTEKSYLLLLDGKTFTTLTVAKLPDFIPLSIHGTWFGGMLL